VSEYSSWEEDEYEQIPTRDDETVETVGSGREVLTA
jgi:hypothetical protein